jgi:hypothetical protein
MAAALPILRVAGRLEPFFETGTEGVVWSLVATGLPGYSGLFPLQEGDELLIYAAAGQPQWRGRVHLEYHRRHRSYPGNPSYGQQEIRGMWVHGFQCDMEPDTWATPFFERAPAVLWRPMKSERLTTRDRFILAEGLTQLATDPWAAWQTWRHLDPHDADQLGDALQSEWRYVCGQMGWPPPELATDPTIWAPLWQRYLAFRQAERLLWTPSATPDDQDGAFLKALWPTPDAFSDVEVERWAIRALPHDIDPPGPLVVDETPCLAI